MLPSGDYLEDDFREPYQTWKAAPTPQANAAMLGHLGPTIDQAIRAHVGAPNPLLTSRARRLALQALGSYDPKRARLRTHLFNQLQGLKRVQRQQTTVLKVPERVALDRHHLENATRELADNLGRDPSDFELAEHTGFSPARLATVRSYHPAVAEGTLAAATPAHEVLGGVAGPAAPGHLWQQIVYDDLGPLDQQIMEHALGLHGRPRLPNQEIAARLGRSPGLISQRKRRIQEQLDRAAELW